MLDSKLQHSSSLSKVTGRSSADMIEPNAMRFSARSDALADECRPSQSADKCPPRPPTLDAPPIRSHEGTGLIAYSAAGAAVALTCAAGR